MQIFQIMLCLAYRLAKKKNHSATTSIKARSMFERFSVKNISQIPWKYVGFGVLCFIVGGSYLAVRDGSELAISPQGSPHGPDVRTVGNSEQRLPIEESPGNLDIPSSTSDSSIDSSYGLFGLSPDEIRTLHARQQGEIEQMLADIDIVAIEPVNDGDMGLTIRELRALHERQERESNTADHSGEIAIQAGEDGSPARSVSQLRDMHGRQEQNLETVNDADKIVIPLSEDGSGGMSRADLTALHKQQSNALKNSGDLIDTHAAPLPEEGSPYLTVEELHELHDSQSSN